MARQIVLPETRFCETCERPFTFRPFPSQLKLGRGRFCSKDCQRRWQTIPLEIRFLRYLGKTNDRGCLIWIGCTNKDGYGVISGGSQNGRMLLAHRVAYSIEFGEIPFGLKVLHKCDNPPCVNVEHLFLGTEADNVRDMLRKGRQRKRTPGSRRFMQELRKELASR